MSAVCPIWLSERRLTAHALSASPIWLWAGDASRILFANAAGAAIFGAGTPNALTARQFDAGQPAAAQILRLANTLSPDGATRLERLRGFGAGIGRALTCNCGVVTLADGRTAVLVVATERAGPDLSLHERTRRLLAGCEELVAVFGEDGTLVEATPGARDKVGEAKTLAEIGPDAGDRVTSDGATLVIFGAQRPVEAAVPPPPAADAAIAEPRPVEQQFIAPRVEHAQTTAEPPTAAPEPPPAPVVAQTLTDRRHPLRFVWQIDADGQFTLDSDDFLALAGPRTRALMGKTWHAIAAALALDPDGHVGRALATHDTFSGLSVAWLVKDERLGVELSGLPVFDRERNFRGYRGFGVCRDVARLNVLARLPDEEESPPPPPTVIVTAAPSPAEDAPALSPVEHNAFQELSKRLTDRLSAAGIEDDASEHGLSGLAAAATVAADTDADLFADMEPATDARPILDRFPVGVLVHRRNQVLYANRAFLRWTGYDSVDALKAAGGLDSLFVEPGAIAIEKGADKTFAISTKDGERKPAEGRLFLIPWDADSAFALVTTPAPEATAPTMDAAGVAALKAARDENAELHAILDTATDGVLMFDRELRILSTNRSLQALFGYDAEALEGQSFMDLLVPESADIALDYIDSLLRLTVASLVNTGHEVIGRERHGGLIPLFMTIGRVGEEKFCAVLRDLTQWKKTEEELIEARRAAEQQSSAKSEFLAKISHEIRTPLNSIIGFAEVMKEERFGPVDNERYRQYLSDIHTSGGHLISLVNDLLDLSKIEAGKLELSFGDVAVNDLVTQCVALMQPQANRERIIIRTSLPPKLPPVTADARSLKQIVLNLLSNSIKFTGAGGQVIVSTALTDAGEVVLRVRDSGQGMSETELAIALEPFRQLATSTRFGSGGTGLGLPLTKALTEANRAAFRITSKVGTGTLVEVTFPAERIAAE